MEPFHWPFVKFPLNFQLDLCPDCFLSVLFILYPFCEESFNSICFVTKCIIVLKNDTKLIYCQWNKKIIQDFSVHIYIDCYLPWSFKWHATPYHKWFEKFIFFRPYFFLCFIWTAPKVPVSLSWPMQILDSLLSSNHLYVKTVSL